MLSLAWSMVIDFGVAACPFVIVNLSALVPSAFVPSGVLLYMSYNSTTSPFSMSFVSKSRPVLKSISAPLWSRMKICVLPLLEVHLYNTCASFKVSLATVFAGSALNAAMSAAVLISGSGLGSGVGVTSPLSVEITMASKSN